MAIERTEAKVMDDVRKLLAKAHDPAASENEREAYLGRANRMMARYAIDMAMLDASRTSGEKRKPVRKLITLFDPGFEWSMYFYSLIQDLARTNRCRVAVHTGYTSMTIVGMQEDVEWTEMLWMQVFFEFVSKLRPSWDLSLSVTENIFNFKNAAYKWKDIWEIGNRAIPGGMPDLNSQFIPNKCKYMITGYKKICEERGVEPVGTQTFAAYKLTFTNYFTWKIQERLETMRAATEEEEASTDGSTIALFDLSKLIDEEFYRLFPELDPEAARRARKEAEEADAAYLAGLSPEDRRAVLGARAEAERQAAVANRKYYRTKATRLTHDAAGAEAGSRAGASVNLTRTGKATESAATRQEISQ